MIALRSVFHEIADMNFFLNGLLHPVLVPHHFLALISLSLYAGFVLQRPFFHALNIWAIALGTGLAATFIIEIPFSLDNILLSISLLVGILLALLYVTFTHVLLFFGSILLLLIGLDSAPLKIPGISTIRITQGLIGTAITGTLITFIGLSLGFYFKRLLNGIPLRILGSWIAAAALMVLMLNLTKV